MESLIGAIERCIVLEETPNKKTILRKAIKILEDLEYVTEDEDKEEFPIEMESKDIYEVIPEEEDFKVEPSHGKKVCGAFRYPDGSPINMESFEEKRHWATHEKHTEETQKIR